MAKQKDTQPEDQRSNLPAPVAPPTALPSLLTAQAKIWTSIPTDTEKGKALAWNVKNGASTPVADMLGEEFEVEHIMLGTYETTDQRTGEVREAVRILFVAPDGSVVSTSSDVIRSDLSAMCALYGAPPWFPPRRLIIRQVRAGKAGRVFKLHIAGEADPGKATRKPAPAA